MRRWEINGLHNNMGYVAGNPFFSREEIQRRHGLAREVMKKVQADVLLAWLCFPAASMAVDPYVTWLTGTSGYKSTLLALLPVQGELQLFFGSSMQGTPGNRSPYLAGQREALSSALQGVKSIACCGLGRMDHLLYQYLQETIPGVVLLDVSDEIDLQKAIKSSEEQEAVAHAVWIQDQLIRSAAGFLRPGRTQQEIYGDILKLLADFGADMSVMPKIFMASGKNGTVGSFPVIAPDSGDHLGSPSYRLTREDWVHLIFETPGLGGYYSETGRIFYFQEPCRRAKETWRAGTELLEYQKELLKPGVTLRSIQAETNRYLKAQGAMEDHNIFQIRGIGNLTTERPQLYEWETMTLQPGMVLNLQPRYTKGDCTAIVMDSFLVTEQGGKRWSKVPQELIVL